MATDCIFCRIAAGEIPAGIVYQDDTLDEVTDTPTASAVGSQSTETDLDNTQVATINDLTITFNDVDFNASDAAVVMIDDATWSYQASESVTLDAPAP